MIPQRGAFGLVPTRGVKASAIRWGTDSPVNHAFIYVGLGFIVEADGGGAVLSDLDKYHPTTVTWSTQRLPSLIAAERTAVADAALDMLGTPYGWADIVAVGLAQRRLGGLIDGLAPLNVQPWWVRRVMTTETLICSQLVDLAYERAGLHLFDDGRLPGLVTPGDLYRLITQPANPERPASCPSL